VIYSFSGTDGVGKSTQIVMLAKYLQCANVDYRILYVRGGKTPLCVRYKKIIKYFKLDASNSIVRRLGIDIAILEMIYLWAIKLRVLNRKDRVVICDRYIQDTWVDFSQQYGYKKGILWKQLEKLCPKPEHSILYHTDAMTVFSRLAKKEFVSIEQVDSIANSLNAYLEIMENFDSVLDADISVDALFLNTLQALKLH
jgi:thymidylate kinase